MNKKKEEMIPFYIVPPENSKQNTTNEINRRWYV